MSLRSKLWHSLLAERSMFINAKWNKQVFSSFKGRLTIHLLRWPKRCWNNLQLCLLERRCKLPSFSLSCFCSHDSWFGEELQDFCLSESEIRIFKRDWEIIQPHWSIEDIRGYLNAQYAIILTENKWFDYVIRSHKLSIWFDRLPVEPLSLWLITRLSLLRIISLEVF